MFWAANAILAENNHGVPRGAGAIAEAAPRDHAGGLRRKDFSTMRGKIDLVHLIEVGGATFIRSQTRHKKQTAPIPRERDRGRFYAGRRPILAPTPTLP